MSKKKRNKNSRDAPITGGVMLCDPAAWTQLLGDGYKPVSDCPEVQKGISVYADLIASMTIQQMENTPDGDVRVKDGLSRKLDIAPYKNMVRQNWMSNLVRVMLTNGNQITLPHYSREGLLEDLEPIAPSRVGIIPEGRSDYAVLIDGARYAPDEVLHFAINPDPEKPYQGRGLQVSLRDVVDSMRQTNATRKAIMKSPTPSLVIKVDGYTDELKTPEAREKLAQKYVYAQQRGEPWVIQSDTFDVKEVKPLTLTDLAIDKNIELDKKTVAALLGVPSFLLGVGAFRAEEYSWFVATQAMQIANIVQQTLTMGVLVSPTRYFRLNNWSLLNYDLSKVNSICHTMTGAAAMRRNEWRNKMGMPYDQDMDDMLILENYLRTNKLTETGGEGSEQTE